MRLISAACSGTIHLMCELIGHDAFFAGQFLDRFADHAFRRAPADQRDGGAVPGRRAWAARCR